MIEKGRLIRRVIALAVLLFVVVGIVYAVSSLVPDNVQPPTPTPVFEPLVVLDQKLITISDRDYDFYVRVRNPNTEFGARSASYSLVLYDGENNQVGLIPGTFFMLPGQTRDIVISPIRTSTGAASAVVVISEVVWQALDDVAANGAQLNVTNNFFQRRSRDSIFARAFGIVENKSDLQLREVEVDVVVYDFEGEIKAVNRSTLYSVKSREVRAYEVFWFLPFDGADDISHVEAFANANIFLDNAFERTYVRTYEDKPFQRF